jgi:CspA family cold shock protein
MGDDSDNRTLKDITGEVKWFDPRKGFGFIIGPDGQDIFVHYTVIEGDGFRVLKDGSKINYDAEHNEKGWRATRAVRLESDAETESDAPEVVVPKRTYTRTPRR